MNTGQSAPNAPHLAIVGRAIGSCTAHWSIIQVKLTDATSPVLGTYNMPLAHGQSKW